MASVNWTNITDFGQIPAAANTVTGGTFWVGMFYMCWIILILLFIGWGFEIAILSASFVIIVLGILAVYADLFAWQHLLSVLGVMLFMFLYIIWSSSKVKI